MHCPFCGKTVTAVPKDYPVLNGKTIQFKLYQCIGCEFEWTPVSEAYRLAGGIAPTVLEEMAPYLKREV